jgi:hypothetical protein
LIRCKIAVFASSEERRLPPACADAGLGATVRLDEPLVALNHFTVPLGIIVPLLKKRSRY